MVGPKCTQTRLWGYSYIPSLRLLFLIIFWVFLTWLYYVQGEIPIIIIIDSWVRGGIVSWLSYLIYWHGWFIPAPYIATQKASIGMYSGCDYPHKSCLCTFWPYHPYFILQFHSIVFFILVAVPFLLPSGQSQQFISFSNTIWHGLLTQFSTSLRMVETTIIISVF